MLDQTPEVSPAAELAGDLEPLAERIGSSASLTALGAAGEAFAFRAPGNVAELRDFTRQYQARVLLPIELPAISQAFRHASRSELREILALDQRLTNEPALKDFAVASQHIGRSQLRALRPLRDQRMLQRYLAALARGEAHGWHTVAYGMILSLYSLPLRPSLLSYARQTMRGFVFSAAAPLQLRRGVCDDLIDELSGGFPVAVNALLTAEGLAPLLLT